MNILFVHQNFPGQYLHLVRHLAAQKQHDVVFLTQRRDVDIPGVRKVVYKPRRAVAPQVHHYLRDAESAVLNAQEVARIALDLRKTGFIPDVMLGHNGWGEIWYLKDIFPEAPLIGYFEFFYRLQGADIGFDPADPITPDTAPRLRTKNLGNLLALDTVDLGQCPTQWQKSGYPRRYHSMINVIHEGIDTQIARPDPAARLTLGKSRQTFQAGDEILTYVARNLEPYRGFHQFMRALPRILAARPKAQVLIVGGDEVSYGARLPPGQSFRQQLLDELGDSLDAQRVHFLGKLPYASFIKVLQISRAHVYLTYPFVLSWSMLEAMAAGALIIGSRTAPVEEVIHHGGNGLLVDFFSPSDIADLAIEALQAPDTFASLRQNARETILERYDLRTRCLPAQLQLINAMLPRRKSAEPAKTRRL